MKKILQAIFPFGLVTTVLEALLLIAIIVSLHDSVIKWVTVSTMLVVYVWLAINQYHKKTTKPN